MLSLCLERHTELEQNIFKAAQKLHMQGSRTEWYAKGMCDWLWSEALRAAVSTCAYNMLKKKLCYFLYPEDNFLCWLCE